MKIGNNIKKLRKLNDMKQKDLANLLGISEKTISSWEIDRTEPNIGMIEKMCIIFKCKKTDIIGNDPEWDSYSYDSSTHTWEYMQEKEHDDYIKQIAELHIKPNQFIELLKETSDMTEEEFERLLVIIKAFKSK